MLNRHQPVTNFFSKQLLDPSLRSGVWERLSSIAGCELNETESPVRQKPTSEQLLSVLKFGGRTFIPQPGWGIKEKLLHEFLVFLKSGLVLMFEDSSIKSKPRLLWIRYYRWRSSNRETLEIAASASPRMPCGFEKDLFC